VPIAKVAYVFGAGGGTGPAKASDGKFNHGRMAAVAEAASARIRQARSKLPIGARASFHSRMRRPWPQLSQPER